MVTSSSSLSVFHTEDIKLFFDILPRHTKQSFPVPASKPPQPTIKPPQPARHSYPLHTHTPFLPSQKYSFDLIGNPFPVFLSKILVLQPDTISVTSTMSAQNCLRTLGFWKRIQREVPGISVSCPARSLCQDSEHRANSLIELE